MSGDGSYSGLFSRLLRNASRPPGSGPEPGPSDPKRRPESSVSSRPSLRSDCSRVTPPYFSNEPGPSHTGRRPESSVSSRPSLRSDCSRVTPPYFSNEPGPSHTGRRPESSVSSRPSLRSDCSRVTPPYFSNEPGPSHTGRRPESSVSSCPSMRSDCSRVTPPYFSNEPGPSHTGVNQRSRVAVEEQQYHCASCQELQQDPVSTSSGHWFCPQCGERFRSRPGPVSGLQEVLDKHKISLKKRCEHVTEGSDKTGSDETGSGTPLNDIYTELFITEGQSEEVNTQHEVRQLETTSKKKIFNDTPIKCHDIFKALPDQRKHIRVVLTNGVAGVGKTFSVQKFTLDWAEGLENQDISVVILLSFRELNLIKDEQYSLLQLLQVFHPSLQKVTAQELAVCKLLFIFDGLDESRLSLDFRDMIVVSDVTQKSSVNVLLTNLIKGNLLPSALIWVTSRPAAANQIPPACVDRATEVRGFTDPQKEKYFKRRVSDRGLSSRIISHVNKSKSLHIMCQIPVFCWITAIVLTDMLTSDQGEELPKTLTEMYSHFLLVQTKKKMQKYDEGHETSPQELMEADREVLLKLGRLAFEQLQKGNIMFYQRDLDQCGLGVIDASVYSGVCTAIFKEERVAFQQTIYCFVHLSIQEFLAAVYMFHCFTYGNTWVLKNFLGEDWKSNNSEPTLDAFLEKALEKSLESENGHLDLFVRFLHGLSLESNHRLLGGLLGRTDNSPEILQRAIDRMKVMDSKETSPDRSINIFHCLMEMNDHSVHQQIQEFMKTMKTERRSLSEIQCSALAYMLQMSDEVLDELDLEMYCSRLEGQWRLIPAVRNCRKARLGGCQLSEAGCASLGAALKSNPHLRSLKVEFLQVLVPGAEHLCAGLESPNCKLESLRLKGGSLHGDQSDALVASALKCNSSQLRELDLYWFNLNDLGLKHLCDSLRRPNCSLEALRLTECGVSETSCAALASALKSNPSNLTELDLSDNYDLKDSGVKRLCEFLQSPNCKLKSLSLWKCRLSEISCSSLASALKSNPSHLRHLELRDNKELRDSGVKLLCDFLRSANCRLETLGLSSCGLSGTSCASLASALRSNPSHLTELDLRGNDLKDSDVKSLCELKTSPRCRLQTLRWKFTQ